MTYLAGARTLYSALPNTPSAARWSLPFPLAVFGTLRRCFANHHLMQLGRIQAHRYAFLPHFWARDLELIFHAGASTPCEVFFYAPDQWQRVIGPVDELEAFVPGQVQASGYHRTLAWLRLLPDSFCHPLFEATELAHERNLAIERSHWEEYEQVPCWVYANVRANQQAREMIDTPVIWDGLGADP